MGDILVNLNHLPDHDPFAKTRMFDDCNNIQDVVKAVAAISVLCFDRPEQLGDFHQERSKRVIDEATQRINELKGE